MIFRRIARTASLLSVAVLLPAFIANSPSAGADPKSSPYGLVVHNLGSTTASSPLPANTVFVGAISSQGSCQGPPVGSVGTASCALGNIANGATAVVGIRVKVVGGAGTTINNTATVSADSLDSNAKTSTSWTQSADGWSYK